MPEAQSDQQGDQTPGGWRAHIFRLAPLVLTLFAAYAIYQARDLEIRSLSEPGPGMWPLIVSSVMGISSLLLIVRDIPEDYEPGVCAVPACWVGLPYSPRSSGSSTCSGSCHPHF